MGDTSIVYSETFGIHTFKREICNALGEEFWHELVDGIPLPDIATESKCQCRHMRLFMKRLEERADAETVKSILYKVRHGRVKNFWQQTIWTSFFGRVMMMRFATLFS